MKKLILPALVAVGLLSQNSALACTWRIIVTDKSTQEEKYYRPLEDSSASFSVGTLIYCQTSITQSDNMLAETLFLTCIEDLESSVIWQLNVTRLRKQKWFGNTGLHLYSSDRREHFLVLPMCD